MKGKKKYILFIIMPIITMLYMINRPSKNYPVISYNNINITEETKEEAISQVDEFQTKYNNKDIIGTLEIPGTNYATVVVQSKDNNYYLRKGLDGKYKREGTPFLDYRVNVDTSKKLLIYGHNSKYVDMPFKILENYYDENYYNNHKYLILTTNSGIHKYEIFSVYTETENWSYTATNFSKDDWNKHLEMLKNNSIYETGITPNEDDQILILQTCSTKKEYQNYKKKFLLIVSRKISS